MKLPKNILSGTYTKPRIFLCETDGSKICQLEVQNMSGDFQFNSMSTLSFEISRFYNDTLTGETKVHPFYDKVEGLRLVELENFGVFEIQGPSLSGDGIDERKSVTANSLEYTLSNRYLKDFYINTGETGSVEVTYAEEKVIEKYGENLTEEQFQAKLLTELKSVSFYDPTNTSLSLLHLILEQAYGWSIDHVDVSLKTQTRKFEVDRQSIYDFITNDLCESFNCYAVFDTLNKKISFYAESLTSKFIGDGTTTQFTISPPFASVNTVSIDGYKTTQWEYNASSGLLTLDDAPESGEHIEVVDGGLQAWETDVFVTFENLSNTIDIDYDADSIKTVLTVTYGEDNDNIREINLGSPDLMDLSYYHTVDWMGQGLYDKYTQFLQNQNQYQNTYSSNTQSISELENQIYFEENKLTLSYGASSAVTSTTVGEYYVKKGTAPNYYYVQVTLPEDYVAGTTYYKDSVANVAEDKVAELYKMLQKYFDTSPLGDDTDNQDAYLNWDDYFSEYSIARVTSTTEGEFYVRNGTAPNYYYTTVTLPDEYQAGETYYTEETFMTAFAFMGTYLNNLKTGLDAAKTAVRVNKNYSAADSCITTFLNKLWTELGLTPLTELYLKKYKDKQSLNVDEGWADPSNEEYPRYYPVLLMISTLKNAISLRTATIEGLKSERDAYKQANITIANGISMSSFFTEQEMIRLSAFLREDELHLDDIVTTDLDSLSDTYKIQQHAMESGKIELNKICQPQLNFSMTMANIYALPEFEPIINQFQLGKVIKIALRDDYIKQSRLLGVSINFEDLSDFSASFGELTALTRQSDIHADLLGKAIQAGKEVASSAGIWTSGADTATATDLKLQRGLISATNSLKSMDSMQAVEWDNYGIHLRKWEDDAKTSYDPKQAWFSNNRLMFTDDNWKTSKMGIGEFTANINGVDTDFYGILAEAVISGYIEGSTINGGTINIGNGAFVVNSNGSVTMSGTNTIGGYATENYVQEQLESFEGGDVHRVEIYTDGTTTITSSDDVITLSCKVYLWDSDITNTLTGSSGPIFTWKRISKSTQFLSSIVDKSVLVTQNIANIIGQDYASISNKTIQQLYNEDLLNDSSWSSDNTGHGLTSIQITANDVWESASFYCEVDLTETDDIEEG